MKEDHWYGPEEADVQDRKQRSGCQGLGWEEGRDCPQVFSVAEMF